VKASSRRLFGAVMALAITAAVVVVSPAWAQEKKPNILFILADNLGFGDLGVYGGGELRGHRRRASISSPPRVLG
jgi:hypothetical protein